MIGLSKTKGKPVYIEETWRPPYYISKDGETLDVISAKSIGSNAYKDLDIKWLQAMVAYASTWNLEGITPFWTQTFFKYTDSAGDALDRGYNRGVMEAIERGERTETFYAFQKLIRQFGKQPP